ncbi:YfaZ family protein [mine drainage metagenome]|uniref:YfaZ family protein n=1 Tax=mine drainage metagenome TaxID=410659 RepID=T1C1U9_9ZZZZ
MMRPSTGFQWSIGFFVLALCLVFIRPVRASSYLNLNVSDHAARVSLGTDLTPSGLTGSVGYFTHTSRGSVADAALSLVANANPGGHAIWVGLGARALFVDASLIHESATALGLGASIHTTWVGYNRIGIGGQVYYAPRVTSFGTARSFLEYEARVGYYLLRHGMVYVAYRHIGVSYAGTPTLILDSGLNVGFRISF